MNQSELIALQGPISNEARVIYTLVLRPGADPATGMTQPLSYRQMLDLLNSKQSLFSLGRQINQLLKELADHGLLDCREEPISNKSLNGKSLLLPLLAKTNQEFDQLHLTWQPMQMKWQPHQALFEELARLVGLLDNQYNQDEVGDFIAYWLSRPEMNLTLFQWTQKFVLHLKRKRLGLGTMSRQVGHQLIPNTPGLTIDDNAKKLVEKYSAKHKG
ncbi:DnaT-like ssDNA-binding domain-containing protein [Bowmanella dokdonensis]